MYPSSALPEGWVSIDRILLQQLLQGYADLEAAAIALLKEAVRSPLAKPMEVGC